jgi:hypothetical protein
MGTMTFQLPAALDAHSASDLERAYVAGGPDNMPWPTTVEVDHSSRLLRVARNVDESGWIVVPWDVPSVGRLMGSSATLMERPTPYALLVEQARGKVNQLRGQLADWRAGGLAVAHPLLQAVHETSLAFGRSVMQPPSDLANQQALDALALAYRRADELVQTYVDQVFEIRHQRQAALETGLGVRLGPTVPTGPAADELRRAFNTVSLTLDWHQGEPSEGQYAFDRFDDVLTWALREELEVTAGPLIDFSSARLPGWLWDHEGNLSAIVTALCTYVDRAVRRYRGKIRRWQLTTASNCARVLGLGEEELLWLTVRLAEAARQVDPTLELVVGVAQPWGEYMAQDEHVHSPFIFADTLIRNSINMAALDLELVMGVSPRGSYARDRLETSRLLDLYSLLGVPMRVTLGYPSADNADPDADPEMRVDAGRWGTSFGVESQAGWAEAFTALAIAKPYVQSVHWVHFADADPHQVPHAGLVDAKGALKPALERLRGIRAAHLT